MEDKPKTEKRVSIIASGYEWTCPKCEYDNNVMSHTETVVCMGCGEMYYTDDPDHAM